MANTIAKLRMERNRLKKIIIRKEAARRVKEKALKEEMMLKREIKELRIRTVRRGINMIVRGAKSARKKVQFRKKAKQVKAVVRDIQKFANRFG